MSTSDGPSMMNYETAEIYSSRGLRPFDHQVAGQSLMLHFDETTISKCLIQREYQFYLTMPKCLRPFVAEFRGVTQLYVPETSSHDCPIGCSCPRLHHHRPSPKDVPLGWQPNHCTLSSPNNEGLSVDPSRWRALQKTTRPGGDINDHIYYFMLLEDLMSRYKNPCVLDLKIGVRQHGDDAPPEKIAYQVNKCKTTTSASLGLRLCGMKRYDAVSDEFETRDKMYGRQLNDEDLKSQIMKFLFNGQDYRLDLVNSILHQLKNLKNVIEQLDGYRFYSSSLLIIYEGCVEGMDEQPEGSNYSSDQHNSDDSLNSQLEKDEDLQYGNDIKEPDDVNSENNIQKTLNISEDTLCTCSKETNDTSQYVNEHRQPICANRRYCRCHYNNPFCVDKEASDKTNNTLSLRKQFNLVDIRLVDFAHATFDGFLGDTVKHYGPDHGILLGVNTLLEIFTELKGRSVF